MLGKGCCRGRAAAAGDIGAWDVLVSPPSTFCKRSELWESRYWEDRVGWKTGHLEDQRMSGRWNIWKMEEPHLQ